MKTLSRRKFLSDVPLAMAALSTSRLFAAPPAPLIGLQLYSVRQDLAKDYSGTLKKVAQIGYREVEAAGFYGQEAAAVKVLMTDAGLICISAHYSLVDLLKDPDKTIDYARLLGLKYVICSAPWASDPAKLMKYPGGPWQAILHSLTLDDWKWNADQFNQLGCKMKAAGIKFGYHNHTPEFRQQDGSSGMEVLLADTDPNCVTLELDCGHAIAGGGDPVALLRKYPGRFSMLHLKDLKPAVPGQPTYERISTEIGRGVVDFPPLFAAAKASGVKHYFVEQEDFDMPVWQALTIDYNNSTAFAHGRKHLPTSNPASPYGVIR